MANKKNNDEILDALEGSVSNSNKKNISSIYGGGDAGMKISDLLSKLPLKFHKILAY